MGEERENFAESTVPLIYSVRKLAAQGHLLHLHNSTVNSSSLEFRTLNQHPPLTPTLMESESPGISMSKRKL